MSSGNFTEEKHCAYSLIYNPEGDSFHMDFGYWPDWGEMLIDDFI